MDSFAVVAQLDEDALRSLLRAGEPRERVWAAWALGLRLGQGAVLELARMTRAEPEPGVRRHLLVVLAGARELDLLAVLARDDPDGYVRAAACQYLGGVAPGDVAVRELLRERLAQDASADVRLAATRALGAVHPIDAEVIRRAVADPNPEVREGALEVLVAAPESLVAMMPEWLSHEPDEALRQRLLQAWSEGAGAEALVKHAADLPLAVAAEVLRFLCMRELAFPWPLLSHVAARKAPSLDRLLLSLLLRPAPVGARPWLLTVAARARPLEDTRRADPETWAPLEPLREVLEAEGAPPLAGSEREDAHRLLHRLVRNNAYWSLTEDDDPGEEDLILPLVEQALSRT